MHAIWLDNTKSPVATVKEKRNEHRDLEACPQKNVVRVTHSRMSENAFFEHGRTFLSSLLFVLWRKTDTLTWKRNACMLHWPIFLVSCACGPTLETNLTQVHRGKIVKVGISTGIFMHETTLWYHHCPTEGCNCSAIFCLLSVGGITPPTLHGLYAPGRILCYFI